MAVISSSVWSGMGWRVSTAAASNPRASAWDSVNGGLAGVEVPAGVESREMDVAWHLDVRPSMQPVVYPDSGELVVNDFRPGSDGGPPSGDLVVVDIASGNLIDRVATGSLVATRDVPQCGQQPQGPLRQHHRSSPSRLDLRTSEPWVHPVSRVPAAVAARH